MQGISFVQFMMDICSHHNLQQSLIETECTEWLLLFLELIDFTDHRARAHLEQFLKSKSKAVKSCRQNIVNYVSIDKFDLYSMLSNYCCPSI